MSFGETVESLLGTYRRWRVERLAGPLGDFFRAGGNQQLVEDLAIKEDDLVLDVGGFRGDWTSDLLCRFGCRSVVLEPIPTFQQILRRRFGLNSTWFCSRPDWAQAAVLYA